MPITVKKAETKKENAQPRTTLHCLFMMWVSRHLTRYPDEFLRNGEYHLQKHRRHLQLHHHSCRGHPLISMSGAHHSKRVENERNLTRDIIFIRSINIVHQYRCRRYIFYPHQQLPIRHDMTPARTLRCGSIVYALLGIPFPTPPSFATARPYGSDCG